MRTSSSLRSSAVSYPSAHTINGRCCCNFMALWYLSYLYCSGFNTVNGKYCCNLRNILRIQFAFTCFNTVNSKYCYFIIFVLPSLCSGTWDVRTSSSLCSSAVSHPLAHTVNGRYCCNNIAFFWQVINISLSFNTASDKCCCNDTLFTADPEGTRERFNTASGRYCCNGKKQYNYLPIKAFKFQYRER